MKLLFSTLKGQTITKITSDFESVTFKTVGKTYKLEHFQDCCESVRLKNVIGDIKDILNVPITLAEEDNPSNPDWHLDHYDDSHTWSVFILEAAGKRVEFWFLRESNG
jgi:hypothetical protein